MNEYSSNLIKSKQYLITQVMYCQKLLNKMPPTELWCVDISRNILHKTPTHPHPPALKATLQWFLTSQASCVGVYVLSVSLHAAAFG